MAELTNPQNTPEPDGATLTIESNSDLGTLYSYSKTTPFTGTEADAAEIMANGVGQAPVVGTNTRVVTGQDPLTDHYAGWVQDSEGYGSDLAMEFHIASDAETLTIPGGAGAYDFHIDWGDGAEEDLTTVGAGPHTYTLAGDYVVRISGVFPHIYFNNSGDIGKLTNVLNLGVVQAGAMNNAFRGAVNCTELTIGASNTVLVGDWFGAFRSMTSLPTDTNLGALGLESAATVASMCRGLLQGAIDMKMDEWNVETIGNFVDFLRDSQLTTACYDRTLASWGNQTLAAGAASTTIHFGTSQYTDQASKDLLLAQVAGIIDGGVAP